jgi:dCTP deaminase
MKLVSRKAILESLGSDDSDSLFIDPLLEPDSQVNPIGVDLRLGYDFLVSIMTRRPAIELAPSADRDRRTISSHFQETRRDLGDTFILYPNQIALGTTLEYVSVPKGMLGEIVSRSSFNRLGVQLSTSIQPGYRGCVSLELFNHGQSPIELVVGGRIVEVRFYEIGNELDYIDAERAPRKYLGNVRPVVSQADRDSELRSLAEIRSRRIEDGSP